MDSTRRMTRPAATAAVALLLVVGALLARIALVGARERDSGPAGDAGDGIHEGGDGGH